MRLNEQQRRIIREAGLRHFGVVPLVFGSRVDDTRRGGDIDLYIDKPMDAALAHQYETRLWVELQKRLGEQKIGRLTTQTAASESVELLEAAGSRHKRWMRRFRGVATSYLENYLGWFRALDRTPRPPAQPAQLLNLAVLAPSSSVSLSCKAPGGPRRLSCHQLFNLIINLVTNLSE